MASGSGPASSLNLVYKLTLAQNEMLTLTLMLMLTLSQRQHIYLTSGDFRSRTLPSASL